MASTRCFKLSHLFTWPAQLWGANTRQLAVAGKSKRTRPTLETLEDRFMPATRIWDAGGANNNWTNNKNWAGDIAPVPGDDLVFPANASKKTADNNFPAGTFFNSISVAGGYTLKGARFDIGSAGITSSGSSNIIKNDIDLGAFNPSPRKFQVIAGSTLFIDGEIRGNTELAKLGTGNLSFRSNNSYTTKTDIQAGILFIEKDNGLGGLTGGTTIRSGAALLFNDQAVGVLRSDELITIDDGGLLRAINAVDLRGNITTLGNASVKHEHDGVFVPGVTELQFSGAISGSGGINVLESASGVVRFKSDIGNFHTGNTIVSGVVVLDVSGGQAIAGNLTINNKGLVYLEKKDTISDTAVVTVNQGGVFDANGRDDKVRRIELKGGTLDGLPKLLSGAIASYLQLPTVVRGLFLNLIPSTISTNDLLATSGSSTSALIVDANVKLVSVVGNTEPVIQVTDGPKPVDLVNEGFIFFETQSFVTRMTMTGGGTMDLNRRAAGTLQIDGGTINLIRSPFAINFDGDIRNTNVIVNSGGKFVSNNIIRSLIVNSGGSFAPGGQGTTGTIFILGDFIMNAGSTLQAEFNGTLPNATALLSTVPLIGTVFSDQKQHDLINVLGSATVAGALLSPKFGPNVTTTQTFRLINLFNPFSSVQGTFSVPASTAPFQLLPNGQRVSFNYTGGSGNDLEIGLKNTPPMAPNLALNHTIINEGGSVTATGHLVDPDAGDRLKLLVNWGDGSHEQVFPPGRDTFALTHRYRDDGNYTARFEWLDQHGTGNSKSFDVTVNNTAPQLELDAFRVLSHRTILAYGLVDDAGHDPFTISIDYGDGSPVRSHSLHHKTPFALIHRYHQSGTFTVTVTARDQDGWETTIQRTVTV